jgi:hypothetical protein
MRSSVAFLVVALCLQTQAQAQEHGGDQFHQVHAAVLLGDSHSPHQNGFTFGGDLEFRPLRVLGVGVTGEHVNQPFRENVWVFPAIVHPGGGLKLSIGPGIERAFDEHAPHHTEQHALLRLGASFDIPLRHGWTIDPDLAVDFVGGEKVVVYAVAVGKEFRPKTRR